MSLLLRRRGKLNLDVGYHLGASVGSFNPIDQLANPSAHFRRSCLPGESAGIQSPEPISELPGVEAVP